MYTKCVIPAMLCLLLMANACQQPVKQPEMKFDRIAVTYPTSKMDTTVFDNYFGAKIADPYRWLEDDNSEETKEWVKQQNLTTFGYLEQIPFRKNALDRLTKLWNFEKYGTPWKKAGKFFFFKNDGLQNQSVLYSQLDQNKEASMVIDPNTFSADGTASLGELGISKDGKYLAYSISEGGSDWRTIYVRDLSTGQNTSDTVRWSKFTGISWAKDGFYYSRFPEPKAGEKLSGANKFGSVFYHKVGTSQKDDELVFADKAHPDRFFGGGTTEDERFLTISTSESTSGNTLQFKDLSTGQKDFTPVVTTFENDFNVLDNEGDVLLVLTNNGAPNQRIIGVDTKNPKPENWKTIIPESKEDVLQGASICGGKLVCQYLHNASSSLRVFDLTGKSLGEIALPEIGTVGGINGSREDGTAFFSFQSFLRPNTIYSLDMATLKPTVFKAPKMDFKSDDFETKQVFYTSKDGTKVPMFITHKKGLKMDGSNPTLLYGYGGFNVSLTPTFSVSRAVMMENDGIYVMANIRGGGEFGETWHKAGTKCTKQNVFDDFIGAAEHLIKEKYTTPAKLAIEGGSNGGLLVGACMTQRPDLFGVAFPRVGVLDMLRYHKFTIGRAWSTDYGLSENEAEFKCLYAYSPLHNLKKIEYPATMVTTADHDDRVVPAHSFKYAAALQKAQSGTKPALVRIETGAGHGAGKPTSKILAEAADMLAFMYYNMGVALK
jgi:prolyl oligopeptidase